MKSRREIGKSLRELRGDKSLIDAAKGIGISKRALRSYEYGERIPKGDSMYAIASYYQVSIEDIFFEKKVH